MKTNLFYAPLLLVSLSMACGKANDSQVSDAGIQNIVKAAQKIGETASAHPVLADELSPVSGPTPAAPVSPAASVTVNAPASPAPSAPVNAPAPSEVAPAASEAAAEALAPITTGNKAIDLICAKSFKALQATTQEEFDAVKLTVATNSACQKVLLSTGGTLITELSALGVSLGLPTASGTVALTASLYSSALASAPDYGDFFIQVIDANVFYTQTYYLPDANEKLDYVQKSIAAITERDPSTLTDVDAQNLMMLNLSLEVQQGTVNKFNTTIAKLNTLANYTSLAAGVGYVAQVLAPAVTGVGAQPGA